jgi:hypothetical protein
MPKNPFNIKSGGGVLKKLIIVGVALGLLALVIKHPHDAAGMVDTAADHGGGIVDSLAQFFRDLGNG